MKKEIRILLTVLLLLTQGSVIKGEETSPALSAANISATPGSTVSLSIDANDLSQIGAMDLNIYYDKDLLILKEVKEGDLLKGSAHTGSVNDDVAGEIRTSHVFSYTLSGSGTLFQLDFEIPASTQPQTTDVIISVGNVCDVDLNPVQLKGTTAKVTIQKTEEQKTVKFESTKEVSAQQGEEVTLKLSTADACNLSAADLVVSYDKNVVKLKSVQLGKQMNEAEGALSSIHELEGCVRIAYTCLYGHASAIDPVLLVTFEMLTDEDLNSNVKFAAENLTDESLNKLAFTEAVSVIHGIKKEVVVEKEKIVSRAEMMENRDYKVTFTIPGVTNFAAGDFVVNYDSSKINCLSLRNLTAEGNLTYNIQDEQGQVKFSYVLEDGIEKDTDLCELVFRTKNNACEDVPVNFLVKHPVNADLKALDLEYVGTSLKMHKYSGSANYTHDITCEVCHEVIFPRLLPRGYRIVFEANGGAGVMEPQDFTYGVAQNLKKNTYERKGYGFTGWKYDGRLYQDEASVNLVDLKEEYPTVTFTAQWQKEQEDLKLAFEFMSTAGVELSWNEISDATEYRLYRKHNDGAFENIFTAETSGYSDKDVIAGDEYVYLLRASSQSGGEVVSNELPVLFNPFEDVSKELGNTVYKAILWAYNNGIVKGSSTTEYSPKADCSRANLCVMLWRLKGSPAVDTSVNPFKDVSRALGNSNFKAILWAYQQGIVKGKGEGIFDPHGATSRANMAVMLWRLAQKPASTLTSSPFTDVSPALGNTTYKSILWAYDVKLTKGITPTEFGPQVNCSRENLAVFLYRMNNMYHYIP